MIVVTFNEIELAGAEGFDISNDSRIVESISPRKSGSSVNTVPSIEARLASVSGTIVSSSDNAMRTALDNMVKNLNVGCAKLRLHSDRFINAVKRDFKYNYIKGTGGCGVNYTIQFLCYDPYFYSTDPVTDDFGAVDIDTGDHFHITPTGVCDTWPKFSILVSGTSVTEINITNSANGKTTTLTFSGGFVAGKTVIVDMAEKSVTYDGNDYMYTLTGAMFPLLPGISNTVTIAGHGGDIACTVEYYNRWL